MGFDPGRGRTESYQFPALNWIRGLDAEGRLNEGQIVLHAEVDMPLKIESPGEPAAAADKPVSKPAAGSQVLPAPGVPRAAGTRARALAPGGKPRPSGKEF